MLRFGIENSDPEEEPILVQDIRYPVTAPAFFAVFKPTDSFVRHVL